MITFVPCFTKLTPISTPFGYILAEDLKIGDFVDTADHGPQPILWIGRKRIDSIDLEFNPKLYPIRICKGAMGENIPAEDILVSRQHRILVRSNIARNMFGTDEVLVPAIRLTDWPGIEIATDVTEVVYIHFMFDQHEIVYAANAPSESFFADRESLKLVSYEMRHEIYELFPQLKKTGVSFGPARRLVSNMQAKKLVARHAKNALPFIA